VLSQWKGKTRKMILKTTQYDSCTHDDGGWQHDIRIVGVDANDGRRYYIVEDLTAQETHHVECDALDAVASSDVACKLAAALSIYRLSLIPRNDPMTWDQMWASKDTEP